MMTPKRIVFLIIGVLFAAFIVQNAEPVQVRFLFWSAQVSRALVLLGTFLLGLIVGLVSGLMRGRERPLPASAKK